MKFEMPEIKVVKIEIVDIIATSNNPCEEMTPFG